MPSAIATTPVRSWENVCFAPERAGASSVSPISRSRPACTSSRKSSPVGDEWRPINRKSTRLNSSHLGISYAVFCLKKKKQKHYSRGFHHVYKKHDSVNRQTQYVFLLL